MATDCDLPPPRSGHISAAFGDFVIIWGGYTDQTHASVYLVERYLSPDIIWIYHAETEKWMRVRTQGDFPPGMSGACSFVLDTSLYVFGGHTDLGNTSEIYELDLTTREWRHLELPQDALKPSPRDKFSGWVCQNKLYIFGGFGLPTKGYLHEYGDFVLDPATSNPERGWNNQLFIFDPERRLWENPQCKGCVPSARAAHATAIIGHQVVLFGGRHCSVRLNDLYLFDVNTLTWSCLDTEGDCPKGRSWHTLTPVSDTHLFLYGGYTQDNKPLSDAWLLDVRRRQWRQVPVSADHPRLWHTASATADKDVVVFGGCCSDILNMTDESNHTNEILQFRFSPRSLLRLSLDAAFAYREVLEYDWDCLPRNLQQRLHAREKGLFKEKPASESGQHGRTCVVC